MSFSQFFTIFWPPAAVLGLHLLRLLIAPQAYEYDMLAHALGGASIGLTAWQLERFLTARKLIPHLPAWLSWFLCISTAELVGVAWEFWEFFIQNRIHPLGLTLEDAILDLALDLAGATILVSVLAWKRRRG